MILDNKLSKLTLNLNNNFKNIKVSVSAAFDRKSMGGQDSKTDVTDKGSKPKQISVSAQIPMDNCGDLKVLLLMAEELDAKDNPIIYDIVDEISYAMSIKKVIFVGSFKCQKNSSLQCFDVSFSLQEKQSIAERRELRKAVKTAPKKAVMTGSIATINAAVKRKR